MHNYVLTFLEAISNVNHFISTPKSSLLFKVTLWSFWSRQVGGYFLLDYSATYLLSCFVLCCTCLMFDCVRKVVGKLANIAITITLQSSRREHLYNLLTLLMRCLASG